VKNGSGSNGQTSYDLARKVWGLVITARSRVDFGWVLRFEGRVGGDFGTGTGRVAHPPKLTASRKYWDGSIPSDHGAARLRKRLVSRYLATGWPQ
jgi:hypothetical protein